MPVRQVEPRPAPDTVPCCPSLADRPLNRAEAELSAPMFKALGDPMRLQLFSQVAASRDELCVCDMVTDPVVAQPTVSFHLRKLREAGLVTCERRGTWVYYRVEPSVLAAMSSFLGHAAR
jgi:ArsR family transcriptional regulator, arsenate/arsenite/antimonite-responsive transcriptional repressor